MKQIDVKLKLFIVLCLTAIGPQAMAQNSTYTLTANGIGPVQLGKKAVELPESVPGLYDSKLSDVYIDEEMPDDEDMPEFATWYFYDEEGETVFTAIQDSLGYISEITISSPNILTAEGLHVGSLPQQVETIKGAQKILPDPMADFGRVSYQLNGITLWIDDYLIDDDHSEERVAAIDISDPVLTAEGIGPVRLGTKATDLPESAPRLYASRVQGPVGTDWHFLDEQGNELFTAKQDKDGAISEITVTSPSINATLGMHVGMPLQQVEYISGLQLDKPDQTKDSISCYDVYDITLNVNKPDNQNIDKDSSLVASMTVPGLLDIIAQNVADTHNKILKFFTQSNSLDELNQHMDEIRQMPQVEEVHSNFETTMFVQFKDLGTFSYSFFPEEPKAKTIEMGEKSSSGFVPSRRNFHSVVIANQTRRDLNNSFLNEKAIPKIKGLLRLSGFSEYKKEFVEMDPSLKFFIDDIFDYDIVLLYTHGFYDNNSGLHFLMTSEESHAGNTVTKDDVKYFISSSLPNAKKAVTIDNKNTVIFDTHNELRLNEKGEKVLIPVMYVGISEKYIESSKKAFNNKAGAIIFNTACHSMKENVNLANAFHKKRAIAYYGYTDVNNVGAPASLEFMSRILSGLSLQEAFNSLNDVVKKDRDAELKMSLPADELGKATVLNPSIKYSGYHMGAINLTLTGTAFYRYINCDKSEEDGKTSFGCAQQDFITKTPIRYGFQISKTENFPEDKTTRTIFCEDDNVDLDQYGKATFIKKNLVIPQTEPYINFKDKEYYIRSFIYCNNNPSSRNYSDKIRIRLK